MALFRLASESMISPGVSVKIVDESNLEVSQGELGEIIVKGPNVADGYLNEPLLNLERFTDGWFHTGDIGFKDEDGYIYFKGRKDDIINVGGEKVSPLEIENIILGAKIGMKDFCVVGIPDEEGIYGNVPVICTTENISLKFDLQKINDLLRSAGLKNTFLLRKLFYIEQIPRTPNGKVLRKQIIEHLTNLNQSEK
jgi:acyl-CoA synthetase (AMP-forming)/AMP-acid ligase II